MLLPHKVGDNHARITVKYENSVATSGGSFQKVWVRIKTQTANNLSFVRKSVGKNATQSLIKTQYGVDRWKHDPNTIVGENISLCFGCDEVGYLKTRM